MDPVKNRCQSEVELMLKGITMCDCKLRRLCLHLHLYIVYFNWRTRKTFSFLYSSSGGDDSTMLQDFADYDVGVSMIRMMWVFS